MRSISRTNAGGLGDGDSFEPQVSWNGSRVAFLSEATNMAPGAATGETTNQVFVRNIVADRTFLASAPLAGAAEPLPADDPVFYRDRQLVFISEAPLTGDDQREDTDVFLKKLP